MCILIAKTNIDTNVVNSCSCAGSGKIVNVCDINYANLKGHCQSEFLRHGYILRPIY